MCALKCLRIFDPPSSTLLHKKLLRFGRFPCVRSPNVVCPLNLFDRTEQCWKTSRLGDHARLCRFGPPKLLSFDCLSDCFGRCLCLPSVTDPGLGQTESMKN